MRLAAKASAEGDRVTDAVTPLARGWELENAQIQVARVCAGSRRRLYARRDGLREAGAKAEVPF